MEKLIKLYEELDIAMANFGKEAKDYMKQAEEMNVNSGHRGKFLKGEPSFEVGKWYNHDGQAVVLYTGVDQGVGFNFIGIWTDDYNFRYGVSRFSLADMSKVSELMIAEAENRGYLGSKIHFGDSDDLIIQLVEDGIGYRFTQGHLTVNNLIIWTPEKGWVEIIEPIFTNSHKTKFYDPNEMVYRVIKKNNELYKGVLHLQHDHEGSVEMGLTELLTKEQAEAYVLDNRVFEGGERYKVAYKNGHEDCVKFNFLDGYFYKFGDEQGYSADHFDSIGDKITF